MIRPRLKRLCRFSLGTMLMLVTAFCAWLGPKVHQVQEQREAVAWVYDHGGAAIYDYEISSTSRVGGISPAYLPADPPGPRWLQQLLGQDYVAPIHMVVLDGSGVNGELPVTSLEPLTAFGELRHLTLLYCDLDDLSPLTTLTTLRTLELFDCSISCEEMTGLRRVMPDCKIAMHRGLD